MQKFITTVDNILGRDNKIKRAACQVFSQSNKYLQLKPVAHTVNVKSICGFSSLDELNGLLEQRNFTQIYNQLTKEPVAKNNFEIDCRILNVNFRKNGNDKTFNILNHIFPLFYELI